MPDDSGCEEDSLGGWFTYLVLTDCNKLYAGITTDVERRFGEHCDVFAKRPGARGAKFFRGRRPLGVVYRQRFSSRAEASRHEWTLKMLSSKAKWRLVEN